MGCALCGRDVPVEETGKAFGKSLSGPDAGPARCNCCVPGRAWQSADAPCAATTPPPEDRDREDRLRRMAERQGLLLSTSRRGEHGPGGHRLYWLTAIVGRVGRQRHRLLVSPDAGMTLDGLEEYLRYGMTRAEIVQYLIRSYGPQFVEELIKHLPRPNPVKPPPIRPAGPLEWHHR